MESSTWIRCCLAGRRTVFANRMLFPAQLAGKKEHILRDLRLARPEGNENQILPALAGTTLSFKLNPLILALPRHAAHQNVPCDKPHPMQNLFFTFQAPALRR